VERSNQRPRSDPEHARREAEEQKEAEARRRHVLETVLRALSGKPTQSS
jgi:hypothetical protein